MATRRWKVSPGLALESVVEEVGAATNSNVVELTVDLSTSLINDGLGTRQISKTEVLVALEKIKNTIAAENWPPA